MKPKPELRKQIMAGAAASRRPTSQVPHELTREGIEPQRQAQAYASFLASKVEAERASMRAMVGRSNEDVEARFAARRAGSDGRL